MKKKSLHLQIRRVVAVSALIAGLMTGFISPLQARAAAILVVTSADHTVAADGFCTLREAIQASNTNTTLNECVHDGSTGIDTINFNIPGDGPHVINVTGIASSNKLLVTEPVVIDACTQPGANCTVWPPVLQIELNGVGMSGSGREGLRFDPGMGHSMSGGLVRGLAIHHFYNSGIWIGRTTDMAIETCFLGTNAAGTSDSRPQGQQEGIGLGVGSANIRIGTDGDGIDDAFEGNVISGNYSPTSAASGHGVSLSASSGGHIVAGNYIGTDPTGMVDNGNRASGVLISSNAYNIRVGTNGDGFSDIQERNIISGNDRDGINISGGGPHDNLIAGNYIGVNAAGNGILANGNQGVILTQAATASNNVVGYNEIGDADAMANVIAGNPVGVQIGDGSTGNTIKGNIIGSSPDMAAALPNNTGIRLLNAAAVLVKDNLVLNSTISGITLQNTASFAAGSTDNCVVFNAAGLDNTTGLGTTFTNNWWGASSGPSGAGPGNGDSVSSNVVYDPFLVSRPAGCPAFEHTITPTAGPGGGITPGTPQTIEDGESITFTIDADPGFMITDVLVDGLTVGTVTSHTFNDVHEDHTIEAFFTLADHSLSGELTQTWGPELITYTLQVTNTGSGTQQVVISGSLPLDTSFVAVYGGALNPVGGDYGVGFVQANAGRDPGQGITLVWVVRNLMLSHQIVNMAHAQSDFGANEVYGPLSLYRWIYPLIFGDWSQP